MKKHTILALNRNSPGRNPKSMKTAYPRVCLTTLAIAGLTGCASVGTPSGAGGINPTVQPNFTTWATAIVSGKTSVVAGDSQQGTYSFDVANNRVTARTVSAQEPGAIFTQVFTTSTVVLPDFWAKDVRLQTPSGTNIRFTREVDTFFEPVSSAFRNYWGIESADGTNIVLMADPLGPNAFSFQSYGIWATGVGTGSGTYGAASVGAPSPAGVIPTEGLATYSGAAGGRHVAIDGSVFFTTADMETSADFFRRELTFTTRNTRQVVDVVSGLSTFNDALNMTGTLNLIPGTNQFSGAVNTFGNVMSGTATGRFYGPAAQEIGGTFSTTGAGVQSYSGAFGGLKN